MWCGFEPQGEVGKRSGTVGIRWGNIIIIIIINNAVRVPNYPMTCESKLGRTGREKGGCKFHWILRHFEKYFSRFCKHLGRKRNCKSKYLNQFQYVRFPRPGSFEDHTELKLKLKAPKTSHCDGFESSTYIGFFLFFCACNLGINPAFSPQRLPAPTLLHLLCR